MEGGSLYIIERTPNLLLANCLEGPTGIRKGPGKVGDGDTTDPRTWHMIVERPAQGREIKTPPMERPVLYQRGRSK